MKYGTYKKGGYDTPQVLEMRSQLSRRLIFLGFYFLVGYLFVSCLFPLKGFCELTLEEVIDSVQKNYEKIVDFKSHFRQETYLPYMNRTVVEEGTVFFKKPGRMRWDYKHPKVKTLYVTPVKAWLYIPKEKIVYVQDLRRGSNSQLHLRLLSGKGNLKEDFTARFDPLGPVDGNGNYLLQLDERRANDGVKGIGLKVDGRNFHILSISFSDVQGNKSVISFKDLRVNGGLPDSVFVFQTPRGVQVFTQP